MPIITQTKLGPIGPCGVIKEEDTMIEDLVEIFNKYGMGETLCVINCCSRGFHEQDEFIKKAIGIILLVPSIGIKTASKIYNELEKEHKK